MMLPSAVIAFTRALMSEAKPKIEHRQGLTIVQKMNGFDPKKALTFQQLKEGPLASLPPHVQEMYRKHCSRPPSGAPAPELTTTGASRR